MKERVNQYPAKVIVAYRCNLVVVAPDRQNMNGFIAHPVALALLD